MLQTSFIRENAELLKARLRKRNLSEEDLQLVDQAVSLDDQRKAQQTELDSLLASRNQMSGEIGKLFKSGEREKAEELRAQVTELKEKASQLEATLKDTQARLQEILYNLPNMPHESVPAGNTDADNEVYQDWDHPMPRLPESAKPHWELAQEYNLFDLELGVKITGSGFPLYRGKGARLQRALISFFLDEATAAGYEEIIPPLMVNAATATATGQLPDKEGQMYHVTEDEQYLIPTAEVPVR